MCEIQSAITALATAVSTGSPVGISEALAALDLAREAAGVSVPVPVASWTVTPEMLAGWGLPVEKRGHIVGAGFVEQAGWRLNVAKHSAWCAGFTRLVGMPESVKASNHAEWVEELAERRVTAAESLAMFKAAGLYSGSKSRSIGCVA